MERLRVTNFKLACVLGLLSYSCGLGESIPASHGRKFICNSKACIDAGDRVIKSRNESVDACDNFFKHACDNWSGIETNIINVPMSQMIRLADEITTLTKEIASDPNPPKNEAMRKFKDYLVACLNYDEVDSQGLTPLDSIVDENGGWPLASQSLGRAANNGQRSIGDIHESYSKIVEVPALVAIKVDLVDVFENGKRSRVNMIHVTLPGKKTDYIANRVLARESEYAVALAKEFANLKGINLPSNINDQVENMLEFGKALKESDVTKGAKQVTIDELQKMWNRLIPKDFSIDVLKIIRSAFEGTDVEIDSKERINLVPGNIVELFGAILKNHEPRDVVNYIHWDAISSLAPLAGKKMMRIFSSSLEDPFDETDLNDLREMQCGYYHKMVEALSLAYIEKYNMTGLRQIVEQMARKIQLEFGRQISVSEWMDTASKSSAGKKIAEITAEIEYPAFYNDLEEHYDDLEVDNKNYLKNVMNYYGFMRRKNLKNLRQPYAPKTVQWPIPSLAVLMPEKVDYNSIIIPATQLQAPYYDAEVQEVLNYGALGSVIGREMARAFDSQDINLDEQGFKRKTWTNDALVKFNERLRCFVNQYSAFSTIGADEKPIEVDGEKTLDSNFADYYGARVALAAYNAQQHETKIKIKSLDNFSDEQLFFYSFAQSLCASPEYYSPNPKQAPESARLNGVVSNMPEFAEAFQCSAGSPMNPEKKCDLK